MFETFYKSLKILAKDIRAGKGAALIGIIFIFLIGAISGFPKVNTSMNDITQYSILSFCIIPLSLVLIKFDRRRSRERRRFS